MQPIATNKGVCLNNNMHCIYGALSVFGQTHVEGWGAPGIHEIKFLLLCREAIVFGGFHIEKIRWGMGHIVLVGGLNPPEKY